MKEIVVATSNKGKVAEIALALANLPVTVLDLSNFIDIPEAVENGDSFAENARIKAEHYVKYTGKACLADDSGLEVDILEGAPGIYSARFAGEDANDDANNQKLIVELAGVVPERRTARFRCVLVFADLDGSTITTEGVKEGVIGQEKRGLGGFGYDSLFYLPEMGKTMAECSKAEKNEISHRGQALKIMTSRLEEYVR
jgi:XTP/dITP diphosphohydrolase